MIRVDHAGEYGATRIYAGQLAVWKNTGPRAGRAYGLQEKHHLETFERS